MGHEASCQCPGPYVVIKYVRPKVMLKANGEISAAPVPSAASVIERSVAEVSFTTGLLLDKFMYHLSLYRQHQRLTASGIHLNRMTLTNLVHRVAQLLEPIYVSLQSSVLLSRVLALDETPIRVGRKVRGKMHQGYLWGLYGDKDELGFHYSPTRSGKFIEKHLRQFVGTLVTDEYSVYERFAAQREEVLHAQCWVHARRKFFGAKDSEPELEKQGMRVDALPVVDEFFSWL